jgi:hypothetical protein
VISIGPGLLSYRWAYRDHHAPRRLHRAKVISGLDRRSAPRLIAVLKLVAEIGVFLDQPSQLGLNKVEKGVYFAFVVAALADRWLAERDVADIGGRQWHRVTSRLVYWSVSQPLSPAAATVSGPLTARIRMNTTCNKTIMDKVIPRLKIWMD